MSSYQQTLEELQNKLKNTERELLEERRDREKRELEFQKIEHRFQNLLENYPNGMVNIFDTKYRYILAEGQELQQLGLTKDKLIGRTIMEVYPKETAIHIMRFLDAVWRGNKIEFEYEHDESTYLVAASPLKNEKGAINQMLVITQNISELKKYQNYLKESEEKFRIFMDHLPAGVFIKDEDGYYQYVNKFNEERFDVINWEGKKVSDYFEEDVSRRFEEEDREVLSKGSLKKEISFKDNNGNDTFINTQYFRINKPEGGHLIGGISLDVTEETKTKYALEKSEEKFRSLAEHAPVAITIIQLASSPKFLYANKFWEEVTGYSKDELNSIMPFDIIHPDDREKVIDRAQRRLRGEDVEQRYEMKILNKSGGVRILDFSAVKIEYENQPAALTSSIDITDAKKAEAAVRKTEKHYRSLIENAPDGVVVINTKGEFEFASPSATRIFGYSEKDLHRLNPDDLTHPDDLPKVLSALDKVIEGKYLDAATIEYRFKHKDGSWKWIESKFSRINEDDGKIKIVINFRDISDRKAADKALLESEARYEAIFNSTTNNVFIYNFEGQFIDANQAALDLMGYRREEIKSLSVIDLAQEEDIPEIYDKVKRLVNGETNVGISSIKLHSKTGDYVWVETDSSLVYKEGKPYGVMGVARDITERKLAEIERERALSALRESETRYRTLFESAGDAIFTMDSETFIDCNEATIKMFGCQEKDDIVGHTPWEFSPEEQEEGVSSQSRASEYIYKAVKGESQLFRWIHCRADGTEFNAEVTLNNFELKGKQFLLAIVRDISDLVEAEEEIRKSEEKYRNIVDWAPEGIYRSTTEGELLFTNKRLAEILGYDSVESLEKKNIENLYYDKKTRNKLIQKYDLHNKSYAKNVEVQWKKENGEPIWVALTSHSIKKEDGTTRYYEGFVTDITERKKADEALSESEKKYRTIFENSVLGIFRSRPDGKLLIANDAFANILGYADSKALLKNISDLYEIYSDKRDRERIVQIFHDKGFLDSYETEFIKKDGSKVWVSIKAKSEQDENGNSYYEGTAVDITEKKFAEQKIKESEQRLITAQKIAKMGDFIWDVNTGDVSWSKPMFELLGYETSEKINYEKVNREMHHPDDLERVTKWLYDSIESGSGQLTPNEYRIFRKDGTLIHIRTQGIIKYENNTIKVLATLQDITDKKIAEEKIKRNEERLKLALDGADLGLWDWNIATGEVVFSEKWAEMLGYSLSELNHNVQQWEELIHPDDLQITKEILSKHLEGKSSMYDAEQRLKTKDGQWRWILDRGKVLERDEKGNPLRAAGTHLDITERKKGEEALKESEERYRLLADNMIDLVALHKPDGEYLYVSSSVNSILGYKPADLVGTSPYDLFHPDDLLKITEESHNRALDGDTIPSVEYRMKTKSGEYIWLQTNTKPIISPEGEVEKLQTVSRDITDRKEAEIALRNSENKFRNIFENVQVGIYRTRLSDGKLLMANQRMAELFGYKTIQGAVTYYRTTDHYVDDDARNKMLKHLKEKGHFDNIEAALTTRSGEVRWFQYSGRLNEEAGFIEGVATDITERKQLQLRYESIAHNFPNGAIWLFDKQMTIRFTAGTLLDRVNLKPEDLTGKTVFQIFNKPLSDYAADAGKKIFSGETVYYENTFNGRVIANWGVPIYHGNHISEGLIYAHDITELKERNEFIQTVMDNLPIGIALNRVNEGDAFYHNKKFTKIYGWPAADFKNIQEFFQNVYPDKKYRLGLQKKISEDIQTGDPSKMHWENIKITRKDGSKRIVNAQNIPLFDQNVMVSTVVDVTAEKKAEEELKESEERYKTLVESAPDAIAIHVDGKLVFVNQAAVKLLEAKNTEELLGTKVSKIVHPDYIDGVQKRVDSILKGNNKFYLIEEKYVSLQGNEIPVEVTAVKILYKNEPGIQVIVRDISERKYAENALRESEEKYRMLIENQTDLVVKVNADGEFEFVSHSYCELFGKSEDKLIGKTFYPLVHKGDRKKTEVAIKKLYRSPYKCYFEQRAKTAKGWRWIGWSDKAVLDDRGNVESIIGVGRDITDRKEAELEVLTERNKAERYLETAAVLMMALDTKGRITMINSKGAKMLGYTKKYIIGKKWIETFVPNESKAKLNKIYTQAMKGQMEFGEYVENPVLCRYNKIRIFGWHNNIIKDENGKITGVLSSAEDITESIMLREELEATNQKLSDLTNHIQKLREEERSKLAREIHDDLGQSLTALKLDLTAARNDLNNQPDKSAKRINSALDLTNTTIRTVQEITSELRPGLIDDLGLIPAIEWYTNQFAERSGIQINTKLNFGEENIVEEHKIVIYRIIQESLTNVARHSGATKVTVKLRRRDNNLELTIKDNGKGISEEQKLKSNSFGLIGMNERADAINGSLDISGENGKGTKIKLLVPLKRK